jgi:hypothetical protein
MMWTCGLGHYYNREGSLVRDGCMRGSAVGQCLSRANRSVGGTVRALSSYICRNTTFYWLGVGRGIVYLPDRTTLILGYVANT